VKRLLVIGAIVAVAAAVGVAIAIAATGSTGSGTNTGGATVSVQKIDGSSVLVDSKGQALYRSDQEQNGMVLCTGSCLSFWQPVTVTGTPKASSLNGKLGVVMRPDGGRQVTYNGRLLYSFKLDSPGQLKGDNFHDAFGGRKFHWHVVRPVGASSSGASNPTPTPTYPGY
jgi:predicted lipoprotein with Yx(FWY)xxD motif